MKNATQRCSRQGGAALLVALLVVTLASVVAVALMERGQRTLARTQALNDAERAWQLARGLDGLAVAWIRRERASGLASTLLDGQWSAPFSVPGGSLRARLIDRSGRFNLNALADPDPARALGARRTFEELLALLNLDRGLAGDIENMIRGGSGIGAPLRLAHISELNALGSWSESTKQRLQPFLAVLPDPRSRINVNRAAPEVLAARIEGLDIDAARRLVAAGPYARFEDLEAQPDLQALANPELRVYLGVESDWYLAHAEIVLNGQLREHYRLVSATGAGYDFRYVSLGIP